MQTRFRLLLSDISNLEKFWLKNTTYRAVKISLLCYIYILQDRTCSEVYDIGDKYIIGYVTYPDMAQYPLSSWPYSIKSEWAIISPVIKLVDMML